MTLPTPIPLEEAQERLLAGVRPLEAEEVSVGEASGRVLAEPLLARRTQPPADLSAMDGYALLGSGPWEIIGESRCGAPFSGAIDEGQAIRISTGALMPEGADTVLLQEDAARQDDQLSLAGDPPVAGKHIRRAGLDFRDGDMVLNAGLRLNPARIALALSAGHASVSVRRRPVVAVLDCGDELTDDPANCAAHQIPASNGAMLCAMIAQAGGDARRIGPVGDDRQALASALAKAEAADVVVTTGGASVGDHDLVQPALKDWGAELDFWRVAIKPGKPLMVAQRGNAHVLGLPGNPVSAYVTASLFLLPLLRALCGMPDPLPRRTTLQAASDLPAIGMRREFIRAYWGEHGVSPVDQQDSSALFALSRANVLIDRPANADEIKAGTDVPVILLENG